MGHALRILPVDTPGRDSENGVRAKNVFAAHIKAPTMQGYHWHVPVIPSVPLLQDGVPARLDETCISPTDTYMQMQAQAALSCNKEALTTLDVVDNCVKPCFLVSHQRTVSLDHIFCSFNVEWIGQKMVCW
jgi:hypothetical protein